MTIFVIGCVFFDSKCFYCEDAIINQKENAIVMDTVGEDDGECAVPNDDKRLCEGYNKDSSLDKLLQMNMGGNSQTLNPTMSMILKKQKKSKCEKLGCCYKAGSKTKDLMMMMMMSNTPNTNGQTQSNGFNPAMFQSILGRKRRSTENLMAMLGGGSLIGPNGPLGGSTSGFGSGLPFGGGLDMNQLLLSKMMSDDDEFDCFAPLDRSISESDECLPSRSNSECGVAGEDSDGSDHSWHLVLSDETDQIHCGATMICSEWAITSASCLTVLEENAGDDFELNQHASIYADVVNGQILENDSKGEIIEIIYHPLYDADGPTRTRLHHDLAVIRIKFGSALSDQVVPICLPTVLDEDPEEIYAFGYGRFGESADQWAGEIKKTRFNATDSETCSDSYGNIDFSQSICADLLDTDATSPICEVSHLIFLGEFELNYFHRVIVAVQGLLIVMAAGHLMV